MRKNFLFVVFTLMASALHADYSMCNPCDSSWNPCGGLSLHGEFLWWKAQNNQNYARTTEALSSGGLTTTTDTNYPYTFGWDPGYRVGFDYALGYCDNGYAIYGDFTYFRSADNVEFEVIQPGTGSIIITSVLNSTYTINGPDQREVYVGSGNLKYERADFGLVKTSYENNWLSIQPKVAFTYVYVRQAFNEVVDRFVSVTSTTTSVGRGKFDFSGYGATLGLDVNYKIPLGFSLFSSLGITPLWGKWNTDTLVISSTILPTPAVTSTRINQASQFVGRWIYQANLGLQYDQCICDWFHVAARVGWEFQTLVNQVNFNRAGNDSSDININGLIAGIEVGF